MFTHLQHAGWYVFIRHGVHIRNDWVVPAMPQPVTGQSELFVCWQNFLAELQADSRHTLLDIQYSTGTESVQHVQKVFKLYRKCSMCTESVQNLQKVFNFYRKCSTFCANYKVNLHFPDDAVQSNYCLTFSNLNCTHHNAQSSHTKAHKHYQQMTVNFMMKRSKQHSSLNPLTLKMKAAHCLEMTGKLTPMMQSQVPEDLNPQNKTSWSFQRTSLLTNPDHSHYITPKPAAHATHPIQLLCTSVSTYNQLSAFIIIIITLHLTQERARTWGRTLGRQGINSLTQRAICNSQLLILALSLTQLELQGNNWSHIVQSFEQSWRLEQTANWGASWLAFLTKYHSGNQIKEEDR
jgi:hypothetical protein